MPLAIEEVVNDPRYSKLSQEGKRQLRNRFLNEVVLKDQRYIKLSDEGKSKFTERLDSTFGVQEETQSSMMDTIKASLTVPEIVKTATEPTLRFAEKVTPELGGKFAQEFPTTRKVIRGGVGATARVLEGFTSPLNLGLLASGYGAPLAIKRAIAGGLAVEIGYELLKTVPDKYRNYKKALDEGDIEEATSIVTESGLNLGIVAGGAKFAVKPPVRAPTPFRTMTGEETRIRTEIETIPTERSLMVVQKPEVVVPPQRFRPPKVVEAKTVPEPTTLKTRPLKEPWQMTSEEYRRYLIEVEGHGAQPRDIGESIDFAGNIRLSKYTPEVRQEIAKIVEGKPELAKHEPISDEKLKAMTAELKGTPIFDQISKMPDAQVAAEALKLRQGDDVALTELLEQNLTDFQKNISLAIAESQTKIVSRAAYELGRGLAQFKIPIEKQTKLAKLFDEKIEQIDKDPFLTKEGKAELKEATLIRRKQVLDKEFNPDVWDKMYEYWINSILSNPKTHWLNSASNLLFAMSKPAEKAFAAASDVPVSLMTGKRTQFFREIPEQIKGAREAFRPSIEFELASGGKFPGFVPAIGGTKGEIIRIPTKALQAEDNLFKRLVGISETFGQAYAQAAREGLKGEALERRRAELIVRQGESIAPAKIIKERVGKEELYRTFQTELEKIGKEIVGFRTRVPGARYIVPFVQIMVNATKRGLERTPLGAAKVAYKGVRTLARKEPYLQEELSGDIGNTVMGSAIAGIVAYKTLKGQMTGDPPKSEKERSKFYEEGKKPRSFLFRDKWIPYKYEPWETAVATTVNAIQDYKEKDEELPADRVANVVSGFSRNLVNKTFLEGINNFIGGLTETGKFQRFAGRLAGGFVPFSGTARFITEQLDETIRKPKKAYEFPMAGIPGLSKFVPPQLTQFGKETKRPSSFLKRFFNVGTVTEDAVVKELERIDYPVPLAPNRLGGIKLTEDQKREYQKEFGPLVHGRLSRVIDSEFYSQMSDKGRLNRIDDSVDDERRKVNKLWRRKLAK